MEVKIVSKETIKPFSSSSTPQRPTTYNLSVLDQLAPRFYVSAILFYSAPPHHQNTNNPKLKKSLSETLTRFYPLAGRIRDDRSCIDCNDEGAAYVEARVAGEMSSVALSQQTAEGFQQLLPLNPYGNFPDSSTYQVLLAVQVNHFDCCGIAIGVCIWHEIADASTLASFVKIWAEIACGRDQLTTTDCYNDVVFDNTSIFIPEDMTSPLSPIVAFKASPCKDSSTTKKLVFHCSKIASLKKQVAAATAGSCDDGLDRTATRFKVLSSLLWGVYMAIDDECSSAKLVVAVDLRKRLNPQFPQSAMGNIWQPEFLSGPPNGCCTDYSGSARRIREGLKVLKDEYIRRLHRNGEVFKVVSEAGKMKMDGEWERGAFVVTSWCRFPFYEVDFGWGEPVSVHPVFRYHNSGVLMDTRDGEGIEAWVTLSKADMEKFLQKPDIVAYASLTYHLIYLKFPPSSLLPFFYI